MDDPRGRLVLPAPSRRLPQLEIPFRLDDAPFTAEPAPTLANGATRQVCLMAWAGSGSSVSADEIAANLVDASGSEHALAIDGSPRTVTDADGTTRYVLTLAPKNVPKGPYRLRLAIGKQGAEARSELRVRVE